MDDATSTIYSAFLIEEEGTASTFRACLDVFTAHGLPSSLYTDRGSHYFHSPEAGGRSERMFGTLQDRLIKELAKASIGEPDAANAWIRDAYLPAHNAR